MTKYIRIKDIFIHISDPCFFGEFQKEKDGCFVYFSRDEYCNYLCVELPNESFFYLKDVFENIKIIRTNASTKGSYFIGDQLVFSFHFDETEYHRFYINNSNMIDPLFMCHIARYKNKKQAQCVLVVEHFSNDVIDKILMLDPEGNIYVSFKNVPILICGDYIVYNYNGHAIQIPKILQIAQKSLRENDCLERFLKRVQIVANKKSQWIKDIFPNVKYFMMESQ